MTDDLDRRLAEESVKVECPLCRHGQWLDAASGRCDQCGSEIEIFGDRAAAGEALEALREDGRVAYRVEVAASPSVGRGLWAVIANRRFPRG